jgi:predicted phage tail protein
MTTKKTTQTQTEDPVTETAEKVGKTVENVMDKLVESQTRLAEAAATARDRSRRVTDECVKSVADAQRDALELTKELASHPSAHGKNIEAILESATATQARAMEMTKLFYREQAEATAEFQKLIAPLFESTKGFADISKNFQTFLQKSA